MRFGETITIHYTNVWRRDFVAEVYRDKDKTVVSISVYDRKKIGPNWYPIVVYRKVLEGEFEFGRAVMSKDGSFKVYDEQGNLLEVISP